MTHKSHIYVSTPEVFSVRFTSGATALLTR